MLLNYAVDPLACWSTEPGTPLQIAQVCDGLQRLARGRHGGGELPLLMDAADQDAEAAYAIANSGGTSAWAEQDERLAWLWVAGSLDHADAAQEIAVILQTQALQLRGDAYRMLIDTAQQWVDWCGRQERVRMGIGEIAKQQKAGSGPIADVEDPQRLGESAERLDGIVAAEELVVEATPGMVVLDYIGDSSSKEGADLIRRYGMYVRRPLKWEANLPAPGAVKAAILARWPWATNVASELESVFAVIRAGDATKVRMPPILLVGEKGSGKTSMMRFVCELAGLVTTVLPMGGVHDGGGVAAVARGWSTSRPSALVTTMFQHGVCNPAFILDEIDKSTKVGSNNGSVMGALLSIVRQPDYMDQCLQAPVNISGLSLLATANSLAAIDANLLDRFKVIRVPNPRPEDYPVLVKNVREDFIAENSLWPEVVPMLDGDEERVLRSWLKDNPSARAFRIAYERVIELRMAEIEQENSLRPN